MAISLAQAPEELQQVLNGLYEYVLKCGATQKKVFKGSDRVETPIGSKFVIPMITGKLSNGSVQVAINGLYYISGSNQMDVPNLDFHIEEDAVIIHNKNNGGSIDIIDKDYIEVSYSSTNNEVL